VNWKASSGTARPTSCPWTEKLFHWTGPWTRSGQATGCRHPKSAVLQEHCVGPAWWGPRREGGERIKAYVVLKADIKGITV
jgi:hypothetical protein